VINGGRQAGVTDESSDSSDAGAKRGIWRWGVPGPILQGLIAFAIYLAVMIYGFALPLLPHLNVPYVQQSQVDANFYIWALRWWPYALSHGLNPLSTTQITQLNGYSGYNLAWATTTPALSVLMWPVTVLVGPVASLNLSLILAPPTAAWATFVLARRLTGRFWPALFAGPVFGFCAYEMSHEASGQPNLTVTLLIPLIGYLILRWWEGSLRRRWFLTWMTLALAAEFYVFVEAFTDLTLIAVIALVIGFAVAARDARPKVARLAIDSAIAYIASVVIASPYLYAALRNMPKTFHKPEPVFWVDLVGVVVPMSDRLFWMKSWLAPTAGHDRTPNIYVGVPLLLLFLFVAVYHWSNRLVRLLVPLYVIVFLLSLGPDLLIDSKVKMALPWGWFWSLPILSSAEPQRLMDFGQLILALVLAIWLAHVTKSKLALVGRWALGAVSIVAIFANVFTFSEVVTPPKPSVHHEWARAYPSLPLSDEIPAFFTKGVYKKYVKPGARVVILSHRGNAGMMIQAYTGFYFNIAGGFINASLSSQDALPIQVDDLTHLPGKVGAERVKAFKSYVHQEKISAIIVERAWAETWMSVFSANSIDLKPITVDGVTIYQIPATYK
jgi:hypothetical protein